MKIDTGYFSHMNGRSVINKLEDCLQTLQLRNNLHGQVAKN